MGNWKKQMSLLLAALMLLGLITPGAAAISPVRTEPAQAEPAQTIQPMSVTQVVNQWTATVLAHAEAESEPNPAQAAVLFHAAGGAPAVQTVEAPVGTNFAQLFAELDAPERDGYILEGWYTAPTGGVEICETAVITVDAAYVVYAQWMPALTALSDPAQTITFYGNGGIPSEQTAEAVIGGTYAQVFGEIVPPVRAGFVFTGWNETADPPGAFIPPGATVEDVPTRILHARWMWDPTHIHIPVIFFIDNNTSQTEWVLSGTRFDETAASITPTRAGYVFDGWFNAPTGGTEFAGDFAITANTEAFARWTPQQHDIVFQFGAGATPDFQVVQVYTGDTFGAAFAAITLPNRARYDFNGWFTAPNGGGIEIEGTDSVTANPPLVLYADWDYIPIGPGGVTFTYTNFPVTVTPAVGHMQTFTIDFTVDTANYDEVIFQWQRNGAPFGNPINRADLPADSITLSLPGVTATAHNGNWTLVAYVYIGTDAAYRDVSRISALTVTGSSGPGPIGPGPGPIEPDDWFEDVCDTSWYYTYVRHVFENNVMNGISETIFRPYEYFSRGQITATLYRVLYGTTARERPYPNTRAVFNDVAVTAWYAPYIAWAYDFDLVFGIGGGRFAAGDHLTREQLATIMHRFALQLGHGTIKLPPSDWPDVTLLMGDFGDSDEVSEWAEHAVIWTLNYGLLYGTSSGNIDPRGNAPRAQAAAILSRFLHLVDTLDGL